MKPLLLATVFLAALSIFQGQAQNNVPPSNPNSSQYHSVYLPSQGLGDTRPNRPNKWGAFAGSEADGASGVGVNQSDQDSAETAALSQCRESGGTNCQVFFVFLNQCAAVASTSHNNAWARGKSLRGVRRDAMKACGSSECRIVFEQCM